MTMTLFTPLQITLILIAITTYILYIQWLRSKYPPGPWPLPIIGNLHQLSRKPYIEFTKMAKIYGPVFTVWMAGRPTVIVADLHHVKEAAVQRGLDFAGRSMDTVGFKIITCDNQDLMTRSYDKVVSNLRTIALSVMKTKAIGGFSILKIVEEEMQHLKMILRGMSGKSVDPSCIARLPVSNVLMRAVQNIRFENEEDPEFVKWTHANEGVKPAMETAVLMSLAQGFAHLMIGAKTFIRSKIRIYDAFIENSVKHHEDSYREGVIRDLTDLVIQYQRSQGNETPDSERIKSVDIVGFVGNMIGGGTLTTLASIVWSCLVLLYRKDVQHKIHRELDDCLKNRKSELTKAEDHQHEGSDQLLFSLSDKPNLPYLNAFIEEVLRLWPPAPMSLPHRTMVDTWLGSHLIPKHTDILFNIYGIQRDEAIWKNSLEFIPQRFLDGSGHFDNSKDKQIFTFGAGARSCVGKNLAKMEIFICLANILHDFKLCCPEGEELPPLDDGHFGLDFSPYPFQAIFKLRKLS